MANEIFVSYAKGDEDFALRFKKAFEAINIEPWIDFYADIQNDNFECRFNRGISISNSVVFILTQNSFSDEFFYYQIKKSLELNKKLFPIICESDGRNIKNKFIEISDKLKNIEFFRLSDNDLEFDETFYLILKKAEIDFYNGNDTFISANGIDNQLILNFQKNLIKNKISFFSNTDSEGSFKKEIEDAHTFVCFLSRNGSKSCQKQLEIAMELKKRIIPILIDETEELPKDLKNTEKIEFYNIQNQELVFEKFLEIYDNEIESVKYHSILYKSIITNWLQRGKPDSELYTGDKLIKAENWLKEAKHRKIKPTQIHEIFINASSIYNEDLENQKKSKKISENVSIVEDDDNENKEEQLIEQTKQRPNDIYAWKELSYLYLENERYNDAITVSTKALDIEKDFDCLLNLAVAYYATSKIKSALIEFKRAIDLVKDVEDIEEIRSALSQAYEINPDSNAVESVFDELDELEKDF